MTDLTPRPAPTGDAASPAPLPPINTYRVQADSPLLAHPFIADTIATSERAAIAKCRGTAFHVYQSVAVFDWDWSVTAMNLGIDFNLGTV